MKSMSRGHDYFTEDLHYTGADDFVCSITNLDQCRDGLYRIRHQGSEDDWEYTLVPLTNHPE